jgi:RNA polymerase sigma-70 factor, ECF subfamily
MINNEPLTNAEFRDQLVAVTPSLRSFARGLCGDKELADDLVQEALLRAWAARDRFAAGSNFRAWMYIILRNQFYTEMRKGRRASACEMEQIECALVEPTSQEDLITVSEVAAALQRLSPAHREVLMLVGANELEYAEAAEILGCALGTVKSRVCRARKALTEELFEEGEANFSTTFARPEGMWAMTTSIT